MNFDLRKPIGMMFSLLGALLVGYGLISGPEIYERSFGLNVNLIWGGVMLVFGALMLWFSRSRTPGSSTAAQPSVGATGPASTRVSR